jgi:GTP cyclohydrolase II
MGPEEQPGIPLVRHYLHLDILGPVEVVVAHGSEESRDLAAIIYGNLSERPLVRIQSRCLYGEVFGSRDCDCRMQLLASLRLLADAGAGVFVYLDQEGRGAGLYGKAQGYELSQKRGTDSFAAYEALEFDPDSRRYADASELLKVLGIHAISLITNNPEKVSAMKVGGLDVIRVRLDPESLGFHIPDEARSYIESKRKRGHLI